MSKRTTNTIHCDICGAEATTEGEGNRSMGFAKGYCENVPKGWGSMRFDRDKTDGVSYGYDHLCPPCSEAIGTAVREVEIRRRKMGPLSAFMWRHLVS